MAGLNKVFLIGNLTRDPELRYTPNGLAVASFTVASNRTYTTQAGERKEDVTFMRVIVWGKRAETCGEYLNKGSSIFVEGRLQTRTWQGQDGVKRNTTEVVANNVQFLGGKRSSSPSKDFAEEDQEPANNTEGANISFEEKSSNSSEDEVPF